MKHDWWRRGPVLLAVPALLMTAGCGDSDSGAGTMVEGADWRGVLLDPPPDRMGLGLDAAGGDTSVPDEADVERFEEALPATEVFDGHGVVEEETVQLDGYVRQYTEVSGPEGRELVVAGMCDTGLIEGWETEWIMVMDGGSCFWDARMDLESGEIETFYFHGMG